MTETIFALLLLALILLPFFFWPLKGKNGRTRPLASLLYVALLSLLGC